MSDSIRHDGQWLRFHERAFRNAHDEPRTWEYVSRKTTVGAVCIRAVRPADEDQLVLVRQFRPPLDAYVVELPAGLIDEGETPAQAALRELEEETGYTGTVKTIGSAVYSSPGLTDEQVIDVTVEVTGTTPQRTEPDEAIEVLTVPLADLLRTLKQLEVEGNRIDAKLWYFAVGRATGPK